MSHIKDRIIFLITSNVISFINQTTQKLRTSLNKLDIFCSSLKRQIKTIKTYVCRQGSGLLQKQRMFTAFESNERSKSLVNLRSSYIKNSDINVQPKRNKTAFTVLKETNHLINLFKITWALKLSFLHLLIIRLALKIN